MKVNNFVSNHIRRNQVRTAIINNTRNVNLNKSIKMNFDEIKVKYSAVSSGKNTNRSTCVSQSGSSSSMKTINIVNNSMNWNTLNHPQKQCNLYYYSYNNENKCKVINQFQRMKKAATIKELAASMSSLNEHNDKIDIINIKSIFPISKKIDVLKSIKHNIKSILYQRSSSVSEKENNELNDTKNEVFNISKRNQNVFQSLQRNYSYNEIKIPKLIRNNPKPKLSVASFNYL